MMGRNHAGEIVMTDAMISPNEYEIPIPPWCMILSSNDGDSECWGFYYGYVQEQGESYCKECEFYKGERK